MKKIKVSVCVIFAASLIVFAAYNVKSRLLDDTVPPVIQTDGKILSVSVSADEAELLNGITAYDDRDGDLTNSIQVASISNFLEPNIRTVTYVVFDRSNNPATVQREIQYTDYIPPRIHTSHSMRYSLQEMNSLSFKNYFTADDSIDGDITGKLSIVSDSENYYRGQLGAYQITLQVNNSAGDILTVPVEITAFDPADKKEKEKIYPALSEYIVYTDGEELDFESYLVGMEIEGEAETFDQYGRVSGIRKSEVDISGDIDYSAAGVYAVNYSYTNDNGYTASSKLYVVVE